MAIELLPKVAGTMVMDAPSAARPEEKLHQALQLKEVLRSQGRFRFRHLCAPAGNPSVPPLEGQFNGYTTRAERSPEQTRRQGRRTKIRVQNRSQSRNGLG